MIRLNFGKFRYVFTSPLYENVRTMSLGRYDFFAPPQIVFGWGRIAEIGSLAAGLGRRAFVVSGSQTLERQGALARVFETLIAAQVEPVHIGSIHDEPQVGDVDTLAAKIIDERDALENDPGSNGDLVLAIGGGSAIDLAKAAAAMVTNRQGQSVADYLEGVGRGLKPVHPPLPLVAVPTTAGTGSEATKNAVISSYDPPFKKSLRADGMVPRIVLVDPELAVTAPPEITAHTGMDAITQLVESYLSRRARPIPQALCLQGLKLALPALPIAFREGSNQAAREAMAHAALLSGMALANSGLGMAHGVAAALGAECRVRHGLACAVMLPVALRANRSACEAELATLGRAVCGAPSTSRDAEAADLFVRRIDELAAELEIPSTLGALGVAREQIPALVAGSRGNSMNGNPRDIGDHELTAILEKML